MKKTRRTKNANWINSRIRRLRYKHDEIVRTYWPDDPPAEQAQWLRHRVWELRQLLEKLHPDDRAALDTALACRPRTLPR